ncbi:MAG: 2-dehydro-3-deoxyphosphooctonate aldolase [Flavobacterium sp.]|nr:MAG: 2-dehydro-3-deoxyphosphooctonate aldolase [Flavobacterium sp.]
MKRIFILVLTVAFLNACSTSKKTTESKNDGKYGYSESNAIKVGGVNDGPKNERKFLNSLTGPNGEKVTFQRKGSCCPFETKNSSYGGMLDQYLVSYEGKKDTVTLYLNMYDSEKLEAPEGFVLKK